MPTPRTIDLIRKAVERRRVRHPGRNATGRVFYLPLLNRNCKTLGKEKKVGNAMPDIAIPGIPSFDKPLDDLSALGKFSTGNDALRSLERRIGKFNIFHALRIERAEIRHSNFLGWILDPSASHEQGSLFLQAVLIDLLRKMPQDIRPLDPALLINTVIHGVNVLREFENIDLLITAKYPDIALVIENKTDSGEHSDQLRKYADRVLTLHPNLRPIFVLLSIDGIQATDARYMSYSYRDVHRVIGSCIQSEYAALATDVRIFIDHYLHLLESRFMQDPQVDKLLHDIYRQHRRAVDLLIVRFGQTASGFVDDLNQMLRDEPDRWHVFKNTSRQVDFVPKSWLDWVPPLGTKPGEDPRSWLVWQLYVKDEVLLLLLCVGRCEDRTQRRRFVDGVSETSLLGLQEIGSKGDGYCKLYRERIRTWKDGDEPTFDSLQEEVVRILRSLEKQLEPLPNVAKGIFGVS